MTVNAFLALMEFIHIADLIAKEHIYAVFKCRLENHFNSSREVYR